MSLSSPNLTKLALLAVMMFFPSVLLADGISASAGYTYSEISPGVYDYSLTLNNTGTTTIGTFWFSWVPGAGFLSATPSSVVSPAGWTDTITSGGKAIRWTTVSDLLNPDLSLSGFGFQSTETPDELMGNFPGPGTGTGDPVTTTYVYIAAPLGDPGFAFDSMLAPEPSSWLLMLTGLGLAAISFRSRLLHGA
jgi:hypothetical protein